MSPTLHRRSLPASDPEALSNVDVLPPRAGPSKWLVGKLVSKGGAFAGAVAAKMGVGPTALLVKLLAPGDGAFTRCRKREHESWEANDSFVQDFRMYGTTRTIWILFCHLSRFRCPSCRAAYCATLFAHPDFYDRIVQMLKFVS